MKYSMGNIFKHKQTGQLYILAKHTSRAKEPTMTFVNLHSGNIWTDPIIVSGI